MSKNAGFTLIELLLVMFILGSLLLIALPRFNNVTDTSIKSASRNLSGIIKYLYNDSIFKNNIYRLTFDIDNNQYWVESIQGKQFAASIDPNLKKRKLPDGIFFEDVFTERSQKKITKGNEVFILFLPSGFVDYAVIHLGSVDNKSYTIETKPYTGGTKIYDRYYDLREKSDLQQTNKLQKGRE